MPVCTVKHDNIDLCRDKRLHALKHICGDADTCAAQQSSLLIFCGERILDRLFNVLDCDESLEIIVVIYYRKFFFSRIREHFLCLLKRDAFLRCDESLRCHGLLYLL